MAERTREPGPLFSAARRSSGVFARRDRDWQIVIVVVCLLAMFLFEMFHSPPCRLGWTSCSGSAFVAQIGVNAIWAVVMGISTGVALAAIMSILVESLDARRSKGEDAAGYLNPRDAPLLSGVERDWVISGYRFAPDGLIPYDPALAAEIGASNQEYLDTR